MIKSRDNLLSRQIEIDLQSPEGNAFYLLDLADRLGRQLNIPESIRKDIKAAMMLDDYENLVKIFDIWFGNYVILYK